MWIAHTKKSTLDRCKIELSISIKQVHKSFIFLRLKHDSNEFPSLQISFWPFNPLLECNAIPTPFLNLYLKFRECVCPVFTPPLIPFFLPSCAFDLTNLKRRRVFVFQLSKFLISVVLLVVQTYWIMILTWWQEPVYI